MTARLAAGRAEGLTGQFAAAGVLGVADVHVADRLGRLAAETDERVLLAAALLVRGARGGSVVLDLATAAGTIGPEVDLDPPGALDPPGQHPTPAVVAAADLPWPPVAEWVAACRDSGLTDEERSTGSPLRQRGTLLWLDRYWCQEEEVAAALRGRAEQQPADLDPSRLQADLRELFPSPDEDDQREASALVAGRRLAVIAGGPGTGKTTTLARLLVAVLRQRPGLRVALAAPTGRAAARLQEAVHGASGTVSAADAAALQTLRASTLHRLLGRRPGSQGRYRHDRDNRLPYDLVVVDESSMVSLTLMARLLEALAPAARLLLVGDPDQLASVEAGAVLGDLVAGAAAAPASPLSSAVAHLRRVHRFEAAGAIGRLATAVRAGDVDTATGLLHSAPEGVEFVDTGDDAELDGTALETLRGLTGHARRVVAAARTGDAAGALAALDAHRLLCAHRGGPRGVRRWDDQLGRWLLGDDPLLVPRLDGHYAGQPLLVTGNDYENRLFNGDTGVVIDQGGELVAAFRRDGGVDTLPLVRLGEVRTLYATTVHKSQGTQYREVTVLLPPADSPLATRQTFYTAVTRATTLVRVVGSAAAVRACVERPAARATGLQARLAGTLD